MKFRRLFPILTATAAALGWVMPTSATVQDIQGYPIEARVWLDRGDEPVLRRGDAVRIYYRVSENAFAAIFHIDTNGNVRMVFPSSPQENHYAVGGRDYRVLFPGSSYWNVDDDPGVGYFFIVASPSPFDFRSFGYSHYAGGWDLSMVGRQVYGDPYLAMDDYVAALIPDWEYTGYGLDFSSYSVDRHYDYPRFLCYDCHGFQPYYSWNPYHYSCTDFRVVIYSDPYFYPVTRYRGTRVVYVQPRVGVPRFGFKERGRGEVGTPQVVVRSTPPPSRPAGVQGTETRRAIPRTGTAVVPGNNGSAGSPQSSGAGRGTPGVAGSSTRRAGGTTPPAVSTPAGRPTGVVPGQSRPVTAPPPTGPAVIRGGASARPTTGTVGTTVPTGIGTSGRPVLERRPTSRAPTTPPARTTIPTRPSSRVIKPGGGGGTTGSGRASGGGTTRPTVRPTGSGGGTTRPTVRPTGSGGGTTRPAVRSTGSGGGTTRPAVRSSGSGGTIRPTSSSGGNVRATGRGATSTPRAQAAKAPPVRKVKTPPRRPGGGGGGGES